MMEWDLQIHFCKNKIIIIANLDIFFTSELNICKTYDFTNLFC